MKFLKKMVSLVLAACMILAMSGMATLAAAPGEKATVTVTGMDPGASMTLYKIASADYNDAGDTFTGYSYVSGAAFANEAEPTSQEINEIAAAIQAGTLVIAPEGAAMTTEDYSEGETNLRRISAEVDIGRYIAIITSSNTSYVYNPVLLTAGYKLGDSGEVIYGGSVDVRTAYAFGETAVAKSSTVCVEKGMEGWTPDETASGEQQQTAGVGDVIHYTVNTTLPAYPEKATNKTFFVTDTMDEGLSFQYPTLTVVWNGENLTPGNDGSITAANGDVIGNATQGSNGFMIIFDYDKLNNAAPVIKYDAVINENAVIGTAEGNENDVKLYYSNNPTNGETWEPEDIPGPATELPEGVTKDEDEEAVYTYRVAFQKTDDNTEDPKPLAGAVFGIYSDEACENLIDTVTTNESGYAESVQVAAGTYYLKEISAPAGYSLNDTVYPITAAYTSSTKTTTATTTNFVYTDNEDEKLAGTSQVGWLGGYPDADGNISYAFYEMNEFSAAGTQADGLVVTAAYVKSATTTTETSETITEAGNGSGVTLLADAIKDSQLGELPSTGGRGVYVFIIIGVAIMSTIAYFYIKGKKNVA